MKPSVSPKKPLQSRHRTIPGQEGSNGQAQVPRMLRRMTKQSFMDIDLQYLMNLDPTTHDPFENSSPVFDDPPSLFRPLPAFNGNHEWMSNESIQLQKEQEELRVQYLQFLHQLNLSNPHGFLVHMNTFATEFPQEFAQLQAYIRHQEQVVNQQREQALREEEMRQYQMQLEYRLQQEQEMQRQQQQQHAQMQEQQAREMQNLLQEWLLKRQKTRTKSPFSLNNHNSKDELDLADVFTMALQKDPKLLERMLTPSSSSSSTPMFPGAPVVSNTAGLDMLLTPSQQHEFAQFLEQKRIQDILSQEESKRRLQQDLASAGFSPLAFQTALSGLGGGSSLSSSSNMNLFGGMSGPGSSGNQFGNNNNNTLPSSSWATAAANAASSSSTPIFSQFQPSLTNDQYLGLKRGGSRKTTNSRR